MELYDNLKGKLVHTSQSAANKVKDAAETVRLNTEISETEHQINELYSKIGYEVYVAYRNNPLPEVAEYIREVTELHNKIESDRALIQTMQSVVVCPNCGAKMNAEMAFCSNCGSRLPEVQPQPRQGAVFCSNCGAQASAGAAFCPACGAKLE